MKALNAASYAILKRFGLKWCPDCATIKVIECFGRGKDQSICRVCRGENSKMKYEAFKGVK